MKFFIISLEIISVLFFYASAAIPEERNSVRRGIASADKTIILDKHNEFRRNVAKGLETRGNPGPQPPASNMRLMKWNNDLAKAAQTWTDRCTTDSDTSIRAGSWSRYGQNIAIGSTYSDWTGVVNHFYDQVEHFNKADVKKLKADHQNTEFYTQMVWSSSYALGCGYTECTNSHGKNIPHYACNYGREGNIVGKPVYQIGGAASACPYGATPKDGLCA